MSLKVADRVKENTTTVGSGILNLVGNTDGFQRFTNVLASGDITYYCIEENNKFEVGIGTYVADTLTRDYILRSSSNGNKINLQGSGVVFITYPADKAVYKNQESQVIIGPSGLIFNDNSIQLTAAKSIDEFNYISGITVNNQSDIVYLSGIAVNAEETLYINYVSGIATYASGQAINNKASITTNSNDIVYLSGLVIAAEESNSISYVSGVANYSSGQSIQNQQQILATSGWAANTFSTINNVNYISGVAVYSSGKSIQNTSDIIYLSGLVINAEESNDLSYVSGIAVYTSGKIYNDTYLSGISVYSSGQSIENEIQINAVSGWADSSFLRENSNSFIYLSGLVVAAEESNDIAYVSGISVYGSGLGLSNASNIVAISGIASYASGQAIYNTNSIANLSTEINYVSGLAVLAEESLDISYVSGVAAYASGKTISNTNDIVYLSGLVVAAEETSAINYVSGIATYSSGQSIANQASIGNLTSNLAYVSGLAVLAEESIDVTYISGIAVYASGKIYNDTYVSGIAVYASGRSIANEVSINNINMDIVYLSGIATNAEETLDINYISGIAVYTSGKIYNDAYLSGIATYASGQSISNQSQINAVSGWADASFLRENSSPFIYLSGLVVAAEESTDINYISGIAIYSSGQSIYNQQQITSVSGWATNTFATNNNLVYVSGISNYASGQSLTNQSNIASLNNNLVYISGLAVLAEESLDINYVSGIAAYSSGRVINNENTILATSGWANSTFATNIDLQYVSGIAVAAEESNDINYISGIAVYVSGNALYNVVEDTSPQLGGNLDTNNYYISGVGNIIGGTGLFSSLKVNNIDVSVSGHTHTASDITNFNISVSGLLPTIANSGDNRVLTSTGSTLGINAEANLTFDGGLFSVAGSGTFASGVNISNQTGSTIASFDANKNVVSLTTATYPSLTELSYVKGVTSALQTQIDGKSSTSHTHGNITSAGAIGSTANLPLITTTAGAITTGSFGSTANTFCQGNDSRLSDARTPLSHTHGNITNAGAIGSTANLPLITTTSGAITTGSFGSTANTFCQGNDARLSDTRTPTDGTVTTAKIVDSNVTYAKIQNVSTTDRILGRSSAGAGVVQEITCTSFGRSLIDDADAAAGRTTLGAAATNQTMFVGTTSLAINRTSAAQTLTGVSIDGTAAGLNSSNYISRSGSSGNANTDFSNTPAGTVRHNGDDSNLTNGPGNVWWFYDNYRHSNGSNLWGTQIAWGWEDNANRLAQRNVTGGSFGAWVYYLNSGNYNSYAPSLTGGGASGTWGISITGNAGGELTGTQVGLGYTLSTATVAYGGQAGPQIRSQGGGGAIMSFHRPGAYAINFGLDSDNILKVGGWSMGAVAYPILHSNNYNSYAPSLTGGGASGTWGINITGNAATASNVNNGTLTLNVSGTGLTGSASFTANQSGNTTFTVTSNATSANTGSTIVARDASGNFSAGTITATLNGNGVKAWCRFSGTDASPITPQAQYNVTNITRLGTGSYQINLSIAISGGNYCAVASSTTVRTSMVGVNASSIFVDTFGGTGSTPVNAIQIHVVAT